MRREGELIPIHSLIGIISLPVYEFVLKIKPVLIFVVVYRESDHLSLSLLLSESSPPANIQLQPTERRG